MLKIMFVCSGNTCRSPMAEMILKNKLKSKDIEAIVSSAGVFAKDGEPISDLTKAVLTDNNISSENFKSRKLTAEMIQESDYIFCMTEYQKMFINSKNAYSIGKFTDNSEVSDPFGGEKENYLSVYNQLDFMCGKILEQLKW